LFQRPPHQLEWTPMKKLAVWIAGISLVPKWQANPFLPYLSFPLASVISGQILDIYVHFLPMIDCRTSRFSPKWQVHLLCHGPSSSQLHIRSSLRPCCYEAIDPFDRIGIWHLIVHRRIPCLPTFQFGSGWL
jgi:hypothetical protein